MAKHPRLAPLSALALTALALGGCGHMGGFSGASLSEHECMARVMYFESNRSSDDGMLAVGTVVMNRLESGRYPKTICGVVGQPRQFADGALTNPVNKRSAAWARAERTAQAVMSGERHDEVGGAKFFHTAGYTFPYRNMHYLTLAGGNVFYEKREPGTFTPVNPNTLIARAETSSPIVVARAEPVRSEPIRSEPTRASRSRPIVLASAGPAPEAGTAWEAAAMRQGRATAPTRPSRPEPTETVREEAPIRAAAPRRLPEPEPAPLPTRIAAAPVPMRAAAPPSPTRLAIAPVRAPAAPARPAAIAATPPPKPIVVAMLAEPKPRPSRPRSIADLIEMDLRQQ